VLISALATDYDGTLATHGSVTQETLAALQRLKASGRKLLMVTGRQFDDLQSVFDHIGLFDAIVAENGALLYRPDLAEEQPLAPAPPPELVERLLRKGVPLSVGRTILATVEPHETEVLAAIPELGLEWQIIFNKGSVMVLPPGVNKASGLLFTLDAMGLSPLNVVGVGDAENDHAFLSACGAAVAVENALPMLKDAADVVAPGAEGEGVTWLIDQLLDGPPDAITGKIRRHDLMLGRADGRDFSLSPDAGATLIAGTSGVGKSTLATALIERILAHGAQLCVIDPEGDYQGLERISQIGEPDRPPAVDEAITLLQRPATSLVVNLLGLQSGERPPAMAELMGALSPLRSQQGRPHWIVVDESHHVLPREAVTAETAAPIRLAGMILITVEPPTLSKAVLSAIETVVAVGPHAADVVDTFCKTLGEPAPTPPSRAPREHEVVAWRRGEPAAVLVTVEPPKQEHQRHVRKYAAGALQPEKSFYFTGPDSRLHLQAQNLALFLQMADGVDDATWLFHLRNHDYSRWFAEAIDDDAMAAEAREAEAAHADDPAESRAAIRRIVSRRYTAPSEGSFGESR
jgi:hypothetical protein